MVQKIWCFGYVAFGGFCLLLTIVIDRNKLATSIDHFIGSCKVVLVRGKTEGALIFRIRSS